MLTKMTQDEINTLCRRSIEAFEYWARNLIHIKLSEVYGKDYLNAKWKKDEYLFSKDRRNRISSIIDDEPERFNRQADALFIEDIIYVLSKEYLYNSIFKEALKYIYPEGVKVCRHFLGRIIKPRNKLSHSNVISNREAEKLICYINDFIEGLKNYYKDKGVERMWNVPQVVRVRDSQGNDFYPVNNSLEIIDICGDNNPFYVNDTYKISIDIDPTFDREEYNILWKYKNKQFGGNVNEITIQFEEEHVAEFNQFSCEILSNKTWHKYGSYDHRIFFTFKVYPLG